MPSITAADVKRLRDATGAGMMDCKNALTEADGDFDAAIEVLRVKGQAKAAKRAERSIANGLVAARGGAIVQLGCETDFVAKNADFQQLAADVVALAERTRAEDVDALRAESLADGRTVAEAVDAVSAVIGEKLELSRVAYLEGTVATYLHRRSADLPPQVGVLVAYDGDEQAARAAAMQVAALKAEYLSREDVPAEVVAKEREIAEATAREEGKPEPALARIVEGRVNGFFKDTVLLEQPSVQEPKQSVRQQLAAAGTTVTRFVRFEV